MNNKKSNKNNNVNKKNNNSNKNNGDDCPICLENLNDNTNGVAVNVCENDHMFHRNCINSQIEQKRSNWKLCPMCRQKLRRNIIPQEQLASFNSGHGTGAYQSYFNHGEREYVPGHGLLYSDEAGNVRTLQRGLHKTFVPGRGLVNNNQLKSSLNNFLKAFNERNK